MIANVRNLRWWGLALLVIGLDQLSKMWANTHLVYQTPKPILPFLNFTLTYNTGAAFGMLNTAGGWQQWLFLGIAAFAVILLTIWLLQLNKQQTKLAMALALILGGAIGNAIDRLYLGFVRDFIDVYYQTWHFAFFNVADAAISVGAFLIVLDVFARPASEAK